MGRNVTFRDYRKNTCARKRRAFIFKHTRDYYSHTCSRITYTTKLFPRIDKRVRTTRRQRINNLWQLPCFCTRYIYERAVIQDLSFIHQHTNQSTIDPFPFFHLVFFFSSFFQCPTNGCCNYLASVETLFRFNDPSSYDF